MSRYTVKAGRGGATVRFHGTFDVNRRSGDVIQLSVIAEDLQKWLEPACETRERMSYAASQENGEFIVPRSSESEFLSTDGTYSVNRTVYTGCRRYTAESVLSFGERAVASAPAKSAALPVKGSALRLRLTSTIDSETSFAGDSVEASLDRPARDSEGVLIPAGTLVRGHLARLEKTHGTHPQVEVALRFDTIALHGAPVPIALQANGRTDDRGRAVFRFAGEKVVLDRNFVSQWRVQ